MDLPLPTELSDPVRAFLALPNYASLATVGEDGEAHQAVIWYGFEADGRILINSRRPRRWPAELDREPRCSIAVIDGEDPFRWVGLQAVVDEVIEDVTAAREDICALAERYGEADAESLARFRTQPRVSYRLRIVGVHDHLED